MQKVFDQFIDRTQSSSGLHSLLYFGPPPNEYNAVPFVTHGSAKTQEYTAVIAVVYATLEETKKTGGMYDRETAFKDLPQHKKTLHSRHKLRCRMAQHTDPIGHFTTPPSLPMHIPPPCQPTRKNDNSQHENA